MASKEWEEYQSLKSQTPTTGKDMYAEYQALRGQSGASRAMPMQSIPEDKPPTPPISTGDVLGRETVAGLQSFLAPNAPQTQAIEILNQALRPQQTLGQNLLAGGINLAPYFIPGAGQAKFATEMVTHPEQAVEMAKAIPESYKTIGGVITGDEQAQEQLRQQPVETGLAAITPLLLALGIGKGAKSYIAKAPERQAQRYAKTESVAPEYAPAQRHAPYLPDVNEAKARKIAADNDLHYAGKMEGYKTTPETYLFTDPKAKTTSTVNMRADQLDIETIKQRLREKNAIREEGAEIAPKAEEILPNELKPPSHIDKTKLEESGIVPSRGMRGKDWVGDRGAIPGEISLYYKDRGGIIEHEIPGTDKIIFEAVLDIDKESGRSLGVFDNLDKAQQAVEHVVNKEMKAEPVPETPTIPPVSEVKPAPLKETPPTGTKLIEEAHNRHRSHMDDALIKARSWAQEVARSKGRELSADEISRVMIEGGGELPKDFAISGIQRYVSIAWPELLTHFKTKKAFLDAVKSATKDGSLEWSRRGKLSVPSSNLNKVFSGGSSSVGYDMFTRESFDRWASKRLSPISEVKPTIPIGEGTSQWDVFEKLMPGTEFDHTPVGANLEVRKLPKGEKFSKTVEGDKTILNIPETIPKGGFEALVKQAQTKPEVVVKPRKSLTQKIIETKGEVKSGVGEQELIDAGLLRPHHAKPDVWLYKFYQDGTWKTASSKESAIKTATEAFRELKPEDRKLSDKIARQEQLADNELSKKWAKTSTKEIQSLIDKNEKELSKLNEKRGGASIHQYGTMRQAYLTQQLDGLAQFQTELRRVLRIRKELPTQESKPTATIAAGKRPAQVGMPAKESPGLLFGATKRYLGEEKGKAIQADFEQAKDYQFKFAVGDKVTSPDFRTKEQKPYIIKDQYIENGEARYTVYPPGKKNSVGYHIWIREKELKAKSMPAKIQIGGQMPGLKAAVEGKKPQAAVPPVQNADVKYRTESGGRNPFNPSEKFPDYKIPLNLVDETATSHPSYKNWADRHSKPVAKSLAIIDSREPIKLIEGTSKSGGLLPFGVYLENGNNFARPTTLHEYAQKLIRENIEYKPPVEPPKPKKTVKPLEERGAGFNPLKPFGSKEQQFARALNKAKLEHEIRQAPTIEMDIKPSDAGTIVRHPSHKYGAIPDEFGEIQPKYGEAAAQAQQELMMTELAIRIDQGKGAIEYGKIKSRLTRAERTPEIEKKMVEYIERPMEDLPQSGLSDNAKSVVRDVKLRADRERKEIIDLKRNDIRSAMETIAEKTYRDEKGLHGTEITPEGFKSKLSDADRQAIAARAEELIKSEIPDDWGIKDYFRHLHLGEFVILRDGKYIGSAESWGKALPKIAEDYTANPQEGINYSLKLREFHDPDVVRVTRGRQYKIINDLAKELEAESPERIREILSGKIGSREAKRKYAGFMKERRGFEGYEKDLWFVLNYHNRQYARWKHLYKLQSRIQPLIQKIKKEGRSLVAQEIETNLGELWGRPQKYRGEYQIKKWAGRLRNLDVLLRLKLPTNVRYHALNNLQLLQTGMVVPYKSLLWAQKAVRTASGKALLDKHGVYHAIQGMGGELAKNYTSAQFRSSKFARTSRVFTGETSNQAEIWLAAYHHAKETLNLPEAESAKYGFLRGMVYSQFLPLKADVPRLLRNELLKSTIGMYRNFSVRAFELGADLTKGTFGGNIPIDRRMVNAGRLTHFVLAQLALGGVRVATSLPGKLGIGGYLTYKAYNRIKQDYGEDVADVIAFGLPGLINSDWSASVQLIDLPYAENVPEAIGQIVLGPQGTTPINIIKKATKDTGYESDEWKKWVRALAETYGGTRTILAMEKVLTGDYDFKTVDGKKQFEGDLKDVLVQMYGSRPVKAAIESMKFDALAEIVAERNEAINEAVLGKKDAMTKFNAKWGNDLAITEQDVIGRNKRRGKDEEKTAFEKASKQAGGKIFKHFNKLEGDTTITPPVGRQGRVVPAQKR